MSDELSEVLETLQRLRYEFEDLAVGGLRAVGPERVTALRSMAEELTRVAAPHIAGRLNKLAEAIEAGDRSAAEHLMRAQSSVRVFERKLTLEVAAATLALSISESDEDAS